MFFDLQNALFDFCIWRKRQRRVVIIVICLSIVIATRAVYLYNNNLFGISLTLFILVSLLYSVLKWGDYKEKRLTSAITDYLIHISKLKREMMEEAYQIITKRYDVTEITYQSSEVVNITFIRDDHSVENFVDIILPKYQLEALYSFDWKLVIEETVKTIPDEAKKHLRKSFSENPSDWLLRKEEEKAFEAYLGYMRDKIAFEGRHVLEELDSDVHFSDSPKQFLDNVTGVPAYQLQPIKSYRVIAILK